MKKIILPIALIFLMSGCKSTISEHKEASFEYNSIGKEEFVFSEIPNGLQKYNGYSEFCKYDNAYSSCNSKDHLKYEDYIGKKAYLTSRENRSKVIVENGDIVYFYGGYDFKFNDREGYIRTSNLQGDYNPEGKTQFLINSNIRNNLCREPDKYCFSVSDEKIKSLFDKKGYFDEREKIKISYNEELLPITMETGERFYFKKESGEKFDGIRGIISIDNYLSNLKILKEQEEIYLKKKQERDSFKPESLHANSNLMLVKYEDISSGGRKYTLSNGETIYSDKLQLIREIAKLPTYKSEIDQFLTQFEISKDTFEGNYFISAVYYMEPYSETVSPEAYINSYIGINEKEIWLRMKIKYYSNEWLFIKKLKTLSDNRRWEFSDIEFKRDNNKYGIKEWTDISLGQDKNMYNVFKDGFNSEKFIIRFVGNSYRKDIEIQDKLKNSNLIKSYEILKEN